jgi:hypothetical protein
MKTQTVPKSVTKAATKSGKKKSAGSAISAKMALTKLTSLETLGSLKEKVGGKKPLIQKEQGWTDEERDTFKKNLNSLWEENNGTLDIKQEISDFLISLRDYNLKAQRMPEAIESHCDLCDLDDKINLGAYGLRPARGNWIIIDTGSKQKNEILLDLIKQKSLEYNSRLVLPSLSPIGFLTKAGTILRLLSDEGPERTKGASKRLYNHGRLLVYACMAYLEIIDEEGRTAVLDVDQEPTRPPTTHKANTEIAWFKTELIKQSKKESLFEQYDLKEIGDNEIEARINFNGRGDLTSQEVISLASRLSEELLIPYKQSKKRETLFKMRAVLTSKIFDKIKGHRKQGLSMNDCILPEKPRYKTTCLWFVRNSIDSRPEILPVETSTNLYYWGNPNSEKELHAIVPVYKQKRFWNVDPQEVKTKIIENQSWLSWFAVGILSLIIAFGLKAPSKNSKVENPKTQETTSQSVVIKKQDVEP